MAVAFDAQSTTDNLVHTVSTSSDTHLTVGSGANRALVVQIVTTKGGGGVTVTGVHWDSAGTNQAATLILASASATLRVELWGLIAPTSGNKTLKVDWSGNVDDGYVSAVAYTGVDQTGGTTSFAHAATAGGTNNAVSLTITSAVGNAVVGVLDTNLANISTISGTSVFIDNNGGASSGAANRAAGAATVTLTSTPNNTWVMAGVDVVAAAAGSVLASTGTGAAAFVGASAVAAILSCAGVAGSSIKGAAAAPSVLASSGAGSAAFTSAAATASVLASSGAGAASFTGAADSTGVMAAAGIAAVNLAGASAADAVLAASGAATVTWLGASIVTAVLSSSGAGAFTAVAGSGTSDAVFGASGVGAFAGVSAAAAASVLASAGTSTVVWSGPTPVDTGQPHNLPFLVTVGMLRSF